MTKIEDSLKILTMRGYIGIEGCFGYSASKEEAEMRERRGMKDEPRMGLIVLKSS
jgi:hypothetical protein